MTRNGRIRAMMYLAVGDVDFKHSGLRAERAEADDIATSQSNGRVVQQAAVDVSSVPRSEISQGETASVAIILDDRMAVVRRLPLCIVIVSIYNNPSVNLATGLAYVDGRTGDGRTQAAGADGRRAQTGCGRG